MMVPVGRLTMVRTFAKSELVRAMSFVAIPCAHRTDAGSARRRPHRRLLPLAADLLRERAVRPRSDCSSSTATCPTTGRSASTRSTIVGPGPLRLRASRCSPTCSRSSESTRLSRSRDPAGSWRSRSSFLAGVRRHATTRRIPLLAARALSHPHPPVGGQRAASSPGSASAACRFSFRCSTRSGSGYIAVAVRSPHHAAVAGGDEPEDVDAPHPDRFGYRRVLLSNTVPSASLIALFATGRTAHAGLADRRCRPSASGSSPRSSTPA